METMKSSSKLETCPKCKGSGIKLTPCNNGWIDCPNCNGIGEVWHVTIEIDSLEKEWGDVLDELSKK